VNLRRLAVVAAALACAVAAPSTAGGSMAMDGVRRTHAVYKGVVTSPALTLDANRVASYPVEPAIEDCGPPGSCDLTTLRLTLPKGTTAGRFRATITMPLELNGAVALFNAEGERVAQGDVLSNGQTLCCDAPRWQVTLAVARLAPGQYTLVVFNHGGQGEFTADVDFKANRPDRQRGKS